MLTAMIGLTGGALSGVLAGFLLSLFESWGKDLRDARLRNRDLPLPRDRVFPCYHWPVMFLGAFQGALLAFFIPPLWAALSILAVLAPALLFLVLAGLFTWFDLLRPPPARKEFDLEILVGKEVREAVRIARTNGWPSEVVAAKPAEEMIGPVDRTQARGRCVLIYERDGKVINSKFREHGL